MRRSKWAMSAMAVLLSTHPATAATLPPHHPLRILIVSDEVNPHSLSDAELTQPGDLSAALTAPGAGLTLDPLPDSVSEIATDSIELATARLELPRCDPDGYDALVYFAHRIPAVGPDPAGRQAAFASAVEQFLQAGGGVVSFHHGAYLTGGKEAMQEIIGATATGQVPWNTTEGQNVINVAPGHFVSSQAVAYTGTTRYEDAALGIPAADYPVFNNTPDERYLTFTFNPTAEQVEVLFASDYDQAGTTHLLGFSHRRAGWSGLVVAYQPGEYQPDALDPAGPNFQVLANALVYAAGALTADAPLLQMVKGAGAGEVDLTWSGGRPTHCIFRSDDPAALGQPLTLVGDTTAAAYTEVAPAATVLYYRVDCP